MTSILFATPHFLKRANCFEVSLLCSQISFFTELKQEKQQTTSNQQHSTLTDLETMTIERQQQLEKIFPRADVRGDDIEFTPPGDDALRKGSDIYDLVSRRSHHILPPSEDELVTKIGKERMILWFGTFYKRMMEDDRMAVLFDTSNKEANVSAAEHGKRLALALWSRWTDDQSYYDEYGPSMFARLKVGHQRAKKCPMRSKNLRGNGFTTGQRNSWLGHLWYAGEECDIPMKDQIVQHLATLMGSYGPFVDTEYEA
jgi:truncated hemoglobin YjbI